MTQDLLLLNSTMNCTRTAYLIALIAVLLTCVSVRAEDNPLTTYHSARADKAEADLAAAKLELQNSGKSIEYQQWIIQYLNLSTAAQSKSSDTSKAFEAATAKLKQACVTGVVANETKECQLVNPPPVAIPTPAPAAAPAKPTPALP